LDQPCISGRNSAAVIHRERRTSLGLRQWFTTAPASVVITFMYTLLILGFVFAMQGMPTTMPRSLGT
jgi:hypothetical protein